MTQKQRVRRPMRDATPILLLVAAHPLLGVVTTAALGGAAALAGRPLREIALVVATSLVGQTVLGWHNDLVDRRVDAAHARTGKPLADGRLEPGTVSFAVACAVLLLIPVSMSNGPAAGGCYLGYVLVGCVGNLALRRGVLSLLPWAISFALLVPFLSFGTWGGKGSGAAPEPAVVALAAVLGIGVHVFVAAWGLVNDAADGWTYLPLRLGRRLGATRLIVGSGVFVMLVAVGELLLAHAVGLSR